MRSLGIASVLVGGVVGLSACGASPAGSKAGATPTPKPTAAPTPPPTATAQPLPAGPFALLVTNNDRQGATYDVLLVDTSAHVVARVTAKLPLLKAHQTITLPLASGGGHAGYYLDGDTDIHSLTADGSHPLVKTISGGTGSALTFAVSPDDRSIAVSLITQQVDETKATGVGYIEDLTDSNNHAEVFNNTNLDAFRWPLAWYGQRIVNAVGGDGCNYAGYGGSPYGAGPPNCRQSIHVIDAATQNRVATICEPPTAAPGTEYYYGVVGAVTPAGVTCTKDDQTVHPDYTRDNTFEIVAVDLTGHERVFDSMTTLARTTPSPGPRLPYTCSLAPDGSRMACYTQPNNTLAFLKSNGTVSDLGRKYTQLGWIDATHLMVDVDANTVAVLNADTGVATTLGLPGADHVQMESVVGVSS